MNTVSGNQPSAIILAAGKGTRMNSDLPKVVHEVGGRPMVCAVVDACRAAGCGRIVVVVGYRQEAVRAALDGYEVEFALQLEQLGTGHAVRSARELFAQELRPDAPASDTFVLCGDGPLIRPETLETLLELHRRTGATSTLATAIVDDPTGYGRIVRDGSGRFQEIVEHKVATPAQRALREVNPSYYCFRTAPLFAALDGVTRNPVSGEYYLTDVLSLQLARGGRVEVIAAVPQEDVLSINTPEELARVDRIYRSRSRAAAPAQGRQVHGGTAIRSTDDGGAATGQRARG